MSAIEDASIFTLSFNLQLHLTTALKPFGCSSTPDSKRHRTTFCATSNNYFKIMFVYIHMEGLTILVFHFCNFSSSADK